MLCYMVGIVVSCHMGEGSTLRKEMIAQARTVTSARGVPLAIQGCDTLEHVLLKILFFLFCINLSIYYTY